MYDALVFGDLGNELRTVFSNSQDENWETIAGYEVHAVDATAAETLEDRGALKASQKEPARYGHKYSWLVRLVQSGTSWAAPEVLERIRTQTVERQPNIAQISNSPPSRVKQMPVQRSSWANRKSGNRAWQAKRLPACPRKTL